METLNKYFLGAVIALVLVVIGLGIYNSNLRRSESNWKHNYEVLQDSVQVVETKYGELLYERGSLIVEKQDLEEALGISKKQIKDYEKKLGNQLAYISKLESEVGIRDTIKVTEVIHDTLSNSYSLSYRDKWFQFNETFSLKNPPVPEINIYDIRMNIPLKVGLTDNYTIFVTSPNPYFKITEIEGAVIDKSRFSQSPQRWFFGLYGGVGGQYDLVHQTFGFGPQLGFGVGVRIF